MKSPGHIVHDDCNITAIRIFLCHCADMLDGFIVRGVQAFNNLLWDLLFAFQMNNRLPLLPAAFYKSKYQFCTYAVLCLYDQSVYYLHRRHR